MGHRDDYWERDGKTVHVPVNEDDNTVQVTHEALAGLLEDAGFKRT